ncbi:hypothetical protein EVU94_00865 [Flavobacteriaceae bacterium 144Ye]|nr:hypothetical protein EVU94_00865 [Flavobacteriaceae bacterium 144Ye]
MNKQIEDILNRIYSSFEKKKELRLSNDDWFFGFETNLYDYENESVLKLYNKLQEIDKSIVEDINSLYYKSEKFNFYFFDCPSIVYEKCFNVRCNMFLKKYNEAREIDFIEIEINKHSSPSEYRILECNGEKLNYDKYIRKLDLNIQKSARNKLLFLNSLLDNTVDERTALVSLNIFKGKQGKLVFDKLLEDLPITLNEIDARGNQAKFISIWKNATSRALIFKPSIMFKDYIGYLNDTYGTNYATRSTSSGVKHEQSIDALLKGYQAGEI